MGFGISNYDATQLNTGLDAGFNARDVYKVTEYNGMKIAYTGDPDLYDSNPNDGIPGKLEGWNDYETLFIDEVTEDLIIWCNGGGNTWFKYYSGIPDESVARSPLEYADSGQSSIIEIAKDSDGIEKYAWSSPSTGETTDIHGMEIGESWRSTDGSLVVTNTSEGYKFTEITPDSIDVPSNAASGSILDLINPGADRPGETIWAENPNFRMNADGTWEYIGNNGGSNSLEYEYRDADGDKLFGRIEVNVKPIPIMTLAVADDGTATVSFDQIPTVAGRIEISSADGTDIPPINVVAGISNYNVTLPLPQASAYGEQAASFTASMTGGGFIGNPVNVVVPVTIPALETNAAVEITQEGDIAHVVVTLSNEPTSEGTIKFTVNGTEYERAFTGGQTSVTVDVPIRKHMEVDVAEISGGGFANTAGGHGEIDFALDAPVLSGLETLSFSEANLAEGTDPDETALAKSGSFAIDMKGFSGTLNIGGIDIAIDKDGNGEVPASPIASGAVSMAINSISNGVVDYTMTLTGSEAHGGQATIDRLFDISVETEEGSASGNVSATIEDDAPVCAGPSSMPKQIWIKATDDEGDSFQKSMWIGENIENLDLAVNPENKVN